MQDSEIAPIPYENLPIQNVLLTVLFVVLWYWNEVELTVFLKRLISWLIKSNKHFGLGNIFDNDDNDIKEKDETAAGQLHKIDGSDAKCQVGWCLPKSQPIAFYLQKFDSI